MSDELKEGMYLKSYKNGKELLIAVCDCDILGKRFEEGPLHIDVCPDFFGNEKATPEEIRRSLSNATIANFVGQQAVNFAINLGYVDRENVLVIDGVPCAQMVLM
ncbi:MAG: DUF424 family protein [Methanotrichaceae archaeon]